MNNLEALLDRLTNNPKNINICPSDPARMDDEETQTTELPQYNGIQKPIEQTEDFKTSTIRLQRLIQVEKGITVEREAVAAALLGVIDQITNQTVQRNKVVKAFRELKAKNGTLPPMKPNHEEKKEPSQNDLDYRCSLAEYYGE